MQDPLVSICCLVYNHEPYIRECLDGFMMQKTDFPFEVLIHDDASTDKSAEIIREYEEKYPEIIKPIYQTENQYSKGIGVTRVFQFPRAKGKYIALCEGDDYWTDPLKLQKQVDFLEANNEYSLCVGGFKKINVYNKECDEIIIIPYGVNKSNEGYDFTLEEIKKGWLTKTLTAVFRNDITLNDKLGKYKYGRDINLFYHILKTGKGFYFTEVMGVYRIHEGGVNSMKHGRINSNAAYNVYKELYLLNRDEWTKDRCFFHTLGLLNYNLFNKYYGNTFKNNLKLYIEACTLLKNISEVKFLITVFVSPKLKAILKS